MMTRPVPDVADLFVAHAEGNILRVYDDARPSIILVPGDRPIGTLTAGTGHTGPDLMIGMPVTPEMSDEWRRRDLGIAADRLAAKVKQPIIDELTDDQYSAFLSFVFNLGTPGSTIWEVANAGSLDQVPVQMMRFDQARGADGQLHVIPGLINRRMAEVALWKTPDADEAKTLGLPAPTTLQQAMASADPVPVRPGDTITVEVSPGPVVDSAPPLPPEPTNAGVPPQIVGPLAILSAAPVAPPPSSVTRAATTPPVVMPMKPLHTSKSFIAQAATAIGGIGIALAPIIGQIHDGVQSLEDAVKPYVGANVPMIDKIDHVAVGILAFTAIAAVLLELRKRQNMATG